VWRVAWAGVRVEVPRCRTHAPAGKPRRHETLNRFDVLRSVIPFSLLILSFVHPVIRVFILSEITLPLNAILR
jgi:hypothetical protein